MRKRHIFVVFMLSMALTLAFSSGISAKEGPKMEDTYRTIIEVEDWGAVITKVILELEKPVPVGSITQDTFNAHVTRSDARLAEPFLEEGYRNVTDAYVSDKEGNLKKNGASKYAVLELEKSPSDSLGLALNYYNSLNDWVDYEYNITQVTDIHTPSGTISGLVIDQFAGETKEIVEDFSFGDFTYEDEDESTTLTYAEFAPKKDKHKNPLIVWLHGGGEGGTDPTIPLSANKATSFATDETQAYFDGAYVLVPQAPTYWMHGLDGRADGTSIYEESLMALIQDYVASHPDIDPNKIYVGGASNGGYMTLVLTRDYPGYFAAAFPVCEGLNDRLISDDDILNMAKTPTWFVTSADDTTLPPVLNTIPTYNRLVEAGADNVHLSLFDHVIDTTGLYTNEDGTPYQYYGHFSWIYVYNNIPETTINGESVSIMEWLATQSLN